MAPLNDQDALVVVVANNVAVRERFKPESAVDVIFQVLHSHLISKILVVKLRRLLLDSLKRGQRLGAEFWRGDSRCLH